MAANAGYYTGKTATPRRVFRGEQGVYFPGGVTIDGSESRDPGNTGDLDVLRPGVLLGKRTANSLYAPSILGVTSEALDGAETTLTVPAATAVEINRRIGASGTFKLTGPPTAAGTVRTSTITYSAVNTSTGDLTITAPGTAAVWTLTPVDGTDGGTFRLRVTLPSGATALTGAITFDATGATFASNIDTAIEALTILPDTAVTVSSVDTTGVSTITFLSSLGDVRVSLESDALTDGGVHEGGADLVHTTAGVDGEFIGGSLIQPTDGSETPLTFVGDANDEYGVKVTDDDDDDIDVALSQTPVGGVVDSSQIINWPSDTSLQAWIVAALNGSGRGNFVFDHYYL